MARGPPGVEEVAPIHPQNGKRLIESVFGEDKDSGRAGAGSPECLPENAQNLAEDELLPGRFWREEQGTWPPPLFTLLSLLPPLQREEWKSDKKKNLQPWLSLGYIPLPDPQTLRNHRSSHPLLPYPCPALSTSVSRQVSLRGL